MMDLTNSITLRADQRDIHSLATELVAIYYHRKGQQCPTIKRDKKIEKVLEILASSERSQLNRSQSDQKIEELNYDESEQSKASSDIKLSLLKFNENDEAYRERQLFMKYVQMPLKNLNSSSQNEEGENSSTNGHILKLIKKQNETQIDQRRFCKNIQNEQNIKQQEILQEKLQNILTRRSKRLKSLVKYQEFFENSPQKQKKEQLNESSQTPILVLHQNQQSNNENKPSMIPQKSKIQSKSKYKIRSKLGQVKKADPERKIIKRIFKKKNLSKPQGRKPEFPEMQTKLIEWIKKMLMKDMKVTQSNIREKAKIIMLKCNRQLGQKFKGSKGWIQKFFRRHPSIFKAISLTNQRKLHEIDSDKQDQQDFDLDRAILLKTQQPKIQEI